MLNNPVRCLQPGTMVTKCLRLNGPIIRLVRHASSRVGSSPPPTGRKVAQRVVNTEKVWAPRPKGGDVAEISQVPLKPTYEPSPIFGAVKSSSKESLKQPISNLKQQPSSLLSSKTKPGKEPRKEEEPMKPLTEDEKIYTYKSFKLKTSVKKLGNLTRQIQHKDIDYAITQMRFSPKRQARNILRGLEHAKEEALRLKDMTEGKIIVDQAWVGRNTYKKQLWPRARGRMNIRMRPYTHFTVMLRSAETVATRQAKVKQKKLESMVRRPSEFRPIYNPRPYYTW